MRTLILITALLIPSLASAETKIFYDKTTKEVLFIAEEKNVTLSDAEATNVENMSVPANLDVGQLDQPLNYYMISKGNVVLNTKKISDIEARLDAIAQKEAELSMIQKRAYKNAYEQLKAEDVKFMFVKDTDF